MQSIGAIALLEHRDGSSLTINVEYNQLEPLLRATINKEGDINDETGEEGRGREGECGGLRATINMEGTSTKKREKGKKKGGKGERGGGKMGEGEDGVLDYRLRSLPYLLLSFQDAPPIPCPSSPVRSTSPPPTSAPSLSPSGRLLALPRQHQPAGAQAGELRGAAEADGRHHLRVCQPKVQVRRVGRRG